MADKGLISINSQQEYKLYPKRFTIMTVHSLSIMVVSIIFGTINPIADTLQYLYKIESYEVLLGPEMYLFTYPIFTFVASKTLQTLGPTKGVWIGIVLVMLGVWLRCLVNQGFTWVTIGFLIAGIGRPFIQNAQGMVSLNWFSDKERLGITQLFSFIVTISFAGGLFWPGVMFNDFQDDGKTNDENANIADGKNMTYNLMLGQAIFSTVCLLPQLIFMRDKPPSVPSFAASVKQQTGTIGDLVRNKNFKFLWVAYSSYMGVFNAFGVVIAYMIQPFNYDSLDASLIGSLPLLIGIFGAIIISKIQAKTKAYKNLLVICMTLSTCTVILFPILLKYSTIAVILISSSINGLFMTPSLPLTIEFAQELTFPVNPALVVGLIYAGGQLWGFLESVIMSAICSGENEADTYWTVAAMLVFCIFGIILLILTVKEDLRRFRAESDHSSDFLKNQKNPLLQPADINQASINTADNL